MSVIAIIPSAGAGKRYGTKIPKQYTELAGIPVIIRTLQNFERCDEIDAIVLSINNDWREFLQEAFKKWGITKVVEMVEGGAERQDSIFNAFKTDAFKKAGIVLVHDAVRPFASVELLKNVIRAAREFDAAVPAMGLKETIKEIDENNFVVTTHDRRFLKSVQTPQGFKKEILLESYEKAAQENFIGTDDASVIEFAGFPVKIIDGIEENIKLTTPMDREFAEFLIMKKG
ncbi:MAG: 2-C-methyl-D-erythritol 4-phosphate cytidylyltransferase [Bacteroidota bacterium]